MQVNFVRPRTGRETSRTIAYQRELLSTSNGRPEQVSGRLRRSAVWGASIWGTEGPEFKSRQPDKQRNYYTLKPVTPGSGLERLSASPETDTCNSALKRKIYLRVSTPGGSDVAPASIRGGVTDHPLRGFLAS